MSAACETVIIFLVMTVYICFYKIARALLESGKSVKKEREREAEEVEAVSVSFPLPLSLSPLSLSLSLYRLLSRHASPCPSFCALYIYPSLFFSIYLSSLISPPSPSLLVFICLSQPPSLSFSILIDTSLSPHASRHSSIAHRPPSSRHFVSHASYLASDQDR